MKKIFHIILLFSFIFSPRLPYIYNGVILSFMLSLLAILSNRQSLVEFYKLLKSNYILSLISFIFIILFYIILIFLFHVNIEYTLIKEFIFQLFNIIVLCMIISVIGVHQKRYIYNQIYNVFFIQSLIIFFFFFFPSYRFIPHFFQSEIGVKIGEYYKGIRTLPISGVLFFGLGTGYGLVFILYLYENSILGIKRKWFLIKFLIVFLASLFVARTALIGFLFIAIILFFRKFKYIIVKLFTVLSVSYFIYIFPPFESLSDFAFKVFLEGASSDGSTSILLKMWTETPISLKTFFLGDGIYTNSDGSFYRHTDVGYHRNILFGGISFFLLLLIYQAYMIFKPFYGGHNRSFLPTILLLYTLVLHLKGEVIGQQNRTFIVLILLFLVPIYYEKRKKI